MLSASAPIQCRLQIRAHAVYIAGAKRDDDVSRCPSSESTWVASSRFSTTLFATVTVLDHSRPQAMVVDALDGCLSTVHRADDDLCRVVEQRTKSSRSRTPRCSGELEHRDDPLTCPSCGRRLDVARISVG